MIADNSAKSIEAFVRANVKPDTTLITDGHAAYPGLSGDYRHDPRVVGNMAANVVLPWSHRAFSLLKRWALLARITACGANMSTPISMSSSFATTAALIGTSRSKRCSGSPRTARQKPIATSSTAARPTKQSFARSHYL